MTLLLHPFVQKTIDAIADNLPQSLLLCGPSGVGLRSIAQSIAGKELAGEVMSEETKNAKGGTISVETVRELYSQTRSKQTKRQIIIIDDADHMSPGAQNAFLKLLEEPNSHTYFILTSHHPETLLPTIRSRVQTMEIKRLLPKQTDSFFETLGISDEAKRTQLRYLAEGLPAEITRLVQDDDYFKQRATIIGDARTFLQATSYEKLLLVQKYRSDREAAITLLESALYMLRRSASNTPESLHITQFERLLSAKEQLIANGNVQLQLARAVL